MPMAFIITRSTRAPMSLSICPDIILSATRAPVRDEKTYHDVFGQAYGLAGLSHISVEAVSRRPVVPSSGRYDHDVIDATTVVLGVLCQQTAKALIDEHDHPARQTVRYVVHEFLRRIHLIAFHL